MTEEYYLDGYTRFCTNCNYIYEEYLNYEEYNQYILDDSNNSEESLINNNDNGKNNLKRS